MRKFYYLSFILLLITFAFSACSSGTLQQDYDALLREKTDIENELESYKDKYDSLKSDYEASLNERTETLLNNLPLEFGKAWATSTFGENTECAVLGNYLYVIVHTDYTINEDNISSIMQSYMSALKIYKATYTITPDQLSFKTISVSFLDINNYEIMKLTFENLNGSFKSLNTLVDFVEIEQIVSGINKYLN